MVKKIVTTIIFMQLFYLACVPESKLLKRNYVRTKYDLNTIDTIMISRVYTNFYNHLVIGFRRDSISEEKGWLQVPIKMKRKLNEYGVELVPNCDTTGSVHRYLPNSLIKKYNPNDEKTVEYLNLFERKRHKNVPGCKCGNRYIAIVFHFGTERTKANSFINNSYFFPIDILTLGIFRIRWNKGYSQMRFIIYDCDTERVIYNGINSRYLIPSDSISVNKHLEILLAKYKQRSDAMEMDSSKLTEDKTGIAHEKN